MIIIDKNHLPLIHKRKQYIEVPLPLKCGMVRKIWQRLIGILLLPGYVFAAWILKAPGITLHFKCTFLAIRLFLLRRISLQTFDSLIFCPMDSTRYFEFHEVLKSLAHVPFYRYLDVSSPRIMPLMLLMQNRDAIANVINPDSIDLQETARLTVALGLTNRCTFANSTIGTVTYAAETFDLITCISVLEHIPSDREAIDKMWSLLRPGGRLVLTLPCMAQPLEQYISHSDYGVLSPGADGYTFWQRYYDEERLHKVIFSITGPPENMVVYGEKSYGLFYRNTSMKRLMGAFYPFWRESYMMAREYRYFKTIAELPGEGVIMLEFVKP
jgi:SAM-dependent methyltransferase